MSEHTFVLNLTGLNLIRVSRHNLKLSLFHVLIFSAILPINQRNCESYFSLSDVYVICIILLQQLYLSSSYQTRTICLTCDMFNIGFKLTKWKEGAGSFGICCATLWIFWYFYESFDTFVLSTTFLICISRKTISIIVLSFVIGLQI